MAKALSQPQRRNAPWTPLQRRTWLVEQRRNHRLQPPPVLRAAYPDSLKWDWDLPNPYCWRIYWSHTTSGPWNFVSDYWTTGAARQFTPDGGSVWHMIVGVDDAGKEVTGRSNAVRPDEATMPSMLLTGLVAHFGFEETSGNRVDGVGSFQLAPINSNPGSTAGVVGNAVAFDGGGSYLAGTVTTSAFIPSSNGLAVSVWVNFTNAVDPNETGYIASVWNDTEWPAGSVWHLFACPNAGTASAEVVGQVNGFNGLYGSGDLSGWSHLCLVYEPVMESWSLYLNATVVATAACDYQAVSGVLCVGAHTNPVTPPPDFLVDELTIWNRTLSAAEVNQLYNSGNGLAYEMF